MNTRSNTSSLTSPWLYFAVTLGWTWLFWAIGIWQGANMETGQGILWLLLGVLGPMITGIAFTYLTRQKEGRRDYWRRVISFRRIPARWYLLIFLLAPVLNALAALLDYLLGGSGAAWGQAALDFVSNPLSLSILLSFAFASLIPFIEELGWRGYVLDRLQERSSKLTSSLILGVVWSLWHLPLFFMPGSYQAGLGIGSLEFWLFFVGVVPLSVVITWVYNHTNRSILASILLHAMINFTGELIAITARADTCATGLWFLAAVGIALGWMARPQPRRREALA